MVTSKFLSPKNDVAFRKIFGSEKHKDILIHFINDVLNLKGSDKVEKVTFLSTIQDPDIAYKKESIVDVLCTDQYGKQIIVEMQVSPQKGFEKRAQYYASKAYSRQLNSGQELGARYQDLKAVIFIAITDYVIFPDKKDYLSNHVILDAKTYERDLKDFSFTFIELPKFNISCIEGLSSIIEKWCYFFKHAPSTSEEDLKKLIGSDLVIQRAYEALNRFNWSEKELFTYEQEIKRIMDNQAVEDYMKQKARQEGREEGIRIGEEKGIRIGEEKGIRIGEENGKLERNVEIAKTMLKEGDSVDKIIRVTGLSRADIQKIK
ncbi:Rpn family recombination-promoting nuclease/putative transposase [Candidatus Cardinium hertigii]|uniref:Rpn family recombination-promoting nuclease/putative transposase n=1 Tax=Candidatus Cardinium hertigii TaxID=247481 RepID=UPI003D7E689D